jgi:hypothetical protein
MLPYLQEVSKNRDSAVRIATGYGLDDLEVGVRIAVGSRILCSPGRRDRPTVHPASCPVGTGGSFSGGKAAGA